MLVLRLLVPRRMDVYLAVNFSFIKPRPVFEKLSGVFSKQVQ